MLLRALVLFLFLASTSFAEGLTLERAVESTLTLQADILYGKLSAESSERAREGAGGAFDHVFSSSAEIAHAQTPLNETEKKLYKRDVLKTEPQTYSLKLSKLTRSGIGIATTASVLNSNDVTPSLTQPRESAATLGVAVNFPIFDLLMENTSTTYEKIARENTRTVLHDYFFQASTSVYQTVVNFWSYLAAYERLMIYRDNEQNTRNMLADFEKLVKTGERPRADAIQIRANLAVRHGQVVEGERDLDTAGAELARSMGVAYDGTALPLPEGRWADVENIGTPGVDESIQRACEKRFDIRSLESAVRSSELMLDASRRGVKPDLDFYVSADFSDKGPHVSGDVVDNARTVKAGVVFSTPLGKRSARSDLAQREIELRQKSLKLANAKRKASFDVASAIRELEQNLKAHAYAMETVKLYQESLRIEEEKLKIGMSTVIDVISIRENYQNALVSRIESLRQVAVSVAGVLYDSGDLVTVDKDRISVDSAAFYSFDGKGGGPAVSRQ